VDSYKRNNNRLSVEDLQNRFQVGICGHHNRSRYKTAVHSVEDLQNRFQVGIGGQLTA
jgi:hypothetical protein